jgi:hypothetical protein
MSENKIDGILFKLAGDIDGDIVTYDGVKYYVHVIDGTIKRLEEQR